MKRIVLTVDDRCITDYTVIAPILKEYGFRCTFFITAKQNIWHGIRDIGDLTWEQIIQLHQDGFEIGNHTFDHFPITHGIERFEEEIALKDRNDVISMALKELEDLEKNGAMQTTIYAPITAT